MSNPFSIEDLEGTGINRENPHHRNVAARFVELLNSLSGQATILAGGATVNVDLDPALDGMPAHAIVEQATADGTLTHVARVFWVSGTPGRLTIAGIANATANTVVRYFVFPVTSGTRS